MRLVIDSREARLLRDLVAVGCEKEFLQVGDIIFKDTSAQVVVERKTWSDLWSSIQDGRYREQRSRLLDYRRGDEEGKILVVYLIEGCHGSLCEEASETCRRALLRLQFAHEVPVIFTGSVEQTIEWVRWVFAMQDLAIFLNKAGESTQEHRVESIQTRLGNQKSSIQNPKTMLITFLRSISGVSYPLATAIAERFASLQDMVRRYDELPGLIGSVEYTTPSQKKRKVGPKLAEKIVRLLGV